MRSLLIIFILCTASASAQVSYQDLSKKAFEHELANRNDSAIFYYQLANLDAGEHSSYTKYKLAGLFAETGNLEESERYYLASLADAEPRGEILRERAAIQLADLYQQQGKFQLALDYLVHSETTYRAKKRLCEGGFGYEHRALFNYKKAVAYYGLGRKQEAVATLAPWVFQPLQLDTSEAAEITIFFVKTACEVYGMETVQRQLAIALDKMNYQLLYTKYSNKYSVFADAYFDFFGTRIPVSFGGTSVDTIYEVPDFLTKRSILTEVRNSLAWIYILGTPNELSM